MSEYHYNGHIKFVGVGFGSYELVLADEIVNLLFEDLEGYPVLDI